jgi:hypothetical protein
VAKRVAMGLGVDSTGGPVIDPTDNVKSLMEASVKSLTREAELLAQLADEKIVRMERELIQQEKVANLRAEHEKEIRKMESDRVNSIRSVDVANAAATATQLLTAVNNYAAAQQATAETLRNQVASTAAAAIASQSALINPIVERVAVLEKTSYTGAGKQAVTDPAMADLVMEMRKLTGTRSEGISWVGALAIGGVVLVSGLLGIAGVLYAALKP